MYNQKKIEYKVVCVLPQDKKNICILQGNKVLKNSEDTIFYC